MSAARLPGLSAVAGLPLKWRAVLLCVRAGCNIKLAAQLMYGQLHPVVVSFRASVVALPKQLHAVKDMYMVPGTVLLDMAESL